MPRAQRKRRRQRQNLTKFQIFLLPSELRDSVLRKLREREAMRVLQVNRSLRNWLLLNGPFGKTLSRIDVVIWSPENGDTSIDFSLENGSQRWTAQRILQHGKALLRQVNSCRRLKVTNTAKSGKRSWLPVEKFAECFPSLLDAAHISLWSFEPLLLSQIFPHFNFRTFDEAHLDIPNTKQWEDCFFAGEERKRVKTVQIARLSAEILQSFRLAEVKTLCFNLNEKTSRMVNDWIKVNGLPSKLPNPLLYSRTSGLTKADAEAIFRRFEEKAIQLPNLKTDAAMSDLFERNATMIYATECPNQTLFPLKKFLREADSSANLHHFHLLVKQINPWVAYRNVVTHVVTKTVLKK
ncbi:unnamed protein product, partial [Mesorhabditis belari]|uniref:Uncharacterized protein n=1 Tax=Mesorhabditis belari TaxID=2138241 RepID=A0AAF3ERC0_9BILA